MTIINHYINLYCHYVSAASGLNVYEYTEYLSNHLHHKYYNEWIEKLIGIAGLSNKIKSKKKKHVNFSFGNENGYNLFFIATWKNDIFFYGLDKPEVGSLQGL